MARFAGRFTISTERIATWRTKQLLGLPAHFARCGRTIQLVEPREVVVVRPPRLEQPLAHLVRVRVRVRVGVRVRDGVRVRVRGRPTVRVRVRGERLAVSGER